MEAKAAYLSTFQARLVYGLLQTEAYARAVLGVENPHRLAGLVAARMDRQRILGARIHRCCVSCSTRACCTGRSVASQVIRERSVSYARLRTSALSGEDSAALIERVMRERYGHRPGPAVA
ncbi:hypothetical protein GCM10010299_30440 [Streptomyces tanashiensis]|nr:hypothetical protein GCM10010299_30440 [Streptomyces tanashiensis]